ncbi:hypothetical protein ACJQWK_11434 [Exserohilum turcicum]
MVYSLRYRRPGRVSVGDHVSAISTDTKRQNICESVKSGRSAMSNGIPEALSFDTIVAGGACPPCTVRDFMNFLKYIELSAENLQFFLWYRDYAKRFEALPESEKVLSPEWTGDPQMPEKTSPLPYSADAARALKGTDFAIEGRVVESDKGSNDPFHTPPRTPSSIGNRPGQSFDSSYESMNASRIDHTERADGAFENAGLKWKPLSVQPYREEISRIISIYIANNGPRQLNLSSRETSSLMHALQHTTHPSAFAEVITSVEWTLRCQAHPNFIRWTICNGNRPRVVFARGLGVAGIVAGLVAAIILTLSSAGRAWRVLSFIGFFIGISTLIAAWKGMCVVLHGMHHRHVRPWELFTSDDEPHDFDTKADSFASMDSQASRNSYEDEPWVARYEKRNLIRKVFDREVWIQEPALRQIQDTIFIQAILGALVLSGVAVGIFCATPKGNLF